MADHITATLDTDEFFRSLDELPAALRMRVNRACEQTAKRCVAGMKRRLEAQLGPGATGATVYGITYDRAYDGNGYVVRTGDELSEGEREDRRRASKRMYAQPSRQRRYADRKYRQDLHVGLWLEKGTKPGKRRNFARTRKRPYFYITLEAEAPGHAERIRDAMRDARADVGFGS